MTASAEVEGTAWDEARHTGTIDSSQRLRALPSGGFSTDRYLARVDRRLADVMAEVADGWALLPDNEEPIEILGAADVPVLMQQLIEGSGKRLRPVMAALGWVAAGGRAHPRGDTDVVAVGAALELLHVFALVHDDVMDESASRRGRASVHVQAARLHEAGSGAGSSGRFGESIAILVGDLAHAEAGHVVAELPVPMRRLWRVLVAELVAGQRRDLVGSARGSRDLDFARSVARMKSGRYTVERPLELGAVAADASEHVLRCLARYGRAVGEAFALRDDLLGIWGDPAKTGKPAGDDLASGKPTVILALAASRMRSGAGREALSRVGTPAFTPADLSVLRAQLQADGVAAAVEDMITSSVDEAAEALQDNALDPDGTSLLTDMARRIAWRDR